MGQSGQRESASRAGAKADVWAWQQSAVRTAAEVRWLAGGVRGSGRRCWVSLREKAGARGELASWAAARVLAGPSGRREKSWRKCGPRGEGRRGRLGRPGKEIERAEGRGVRGLGLEPSWAGFFPISFSFSISNSNQTKLI